MKAFRASLCSCLLTAMALASPGCATTSSSRTTNETVLTKSDQPWDDQSPVEKAKSVMWWTFQTAFPLAGEALGGR